MHPHNGCGEHRGSSGPTPQVNNPSIGASSQLRRPTRHDVWQGVDVLVTECWCISTHTHASRCWHHQTDVDGDDSFTYSITTDPSGVFYVSENEVRVGSAFEDLSPGQLVAINVTTTDAGGLTHTREVSTVVVRSKNAILAALGIAAGVLSVAAAIVAVFYVNSTSMTAAAAGAGSEV